MHMADALLSPPVGLTAGLTAAVLVGVSARRAGAEPEHARRVPLMGVLAAFVFAAQMINFSIPGTGSSGHLGGGLLLAVLLGPHAAFIAMASVLTIQCLLFADGGLLALGCNVINLAFWPCYAGLPLFRRLAGAAAAPRRTAAAAVIAAIVSLQLGAAGVVIETVLSGRSELPFAHFGAVMLGIHLPIGLVEGLVTAGVIRALRLATGATASTAPARGAPVLAGLALTALLVSGVFAWFASDRPDGLEWSVGRVAGTEALDAPRNAVHNGMATLQRKTSMLPDYQLPGSTARLGISVAGISGSIVAGLLVSALALGVSRVGRGRPRTEGS